MSKTILTMTEEEYSSAALFGMGHPGVCLACGEYDEYAGCEPDAENYECPACGKRKLMGLELAFVSGYVDITG